MDRYYKNIILCGEVDYYCLLCKEAFESPNQIERHIRWEQHRKNMKSLSYNVKYIDHRIYKINKYFYCEVCNYATKYKTLVNNHINDYQHLFRKSNPSVPMSIPRGDDKVTLKKKGKVKKVDKFRSHGIVNNYCTVCNVPIQNIDHIEEIDHMVALVQTDQWQREYNIRQISKNEENDTKGCAKASKQAKKNAIVNKILTPADEDNETVIDHLKKEKKYFYINLKESRARCVQCKMAIVDLTLSSLTAHRSAHKTENDESDSGDDSVEYNGIVDHGKRRSLIKEYGKRHYIKLNEGGSKGYCNLCDINISPNLNMVQQHVRGTRHQGMLYARGIKKGLHNDHTFCPPMIQPFHVFLQQIKFSAELNVICLNNTIYVNTFSFYFLLPVNNSKIKCFICNEANDYQEMAVHVSSNAHMKKVVSASMANIDYDPRFADEFVRKMQRDLYHCGFCNKVLPYWDTTQLHLKSREHRFAKTKNQAVCKEPEEIFNKSKFVKSQNNNALLKKLKNFYP